MANYLEINSTHLNLGLLTHLLPFVHLRLLHLAQFLVVALFAKQVAIIEVRWKVGTCSEHLVLQPMQPVKQNFRLLFKRIVAIIHTFHIHIISHLTPQCCSG